MKNKNQQLKKIINSNINDNQNYLTPIPMNPKKSIIKNNYDKRELNNAQKNAVFLRRVEYSKNMRKNYNKIIIEQEILENIILIQKWWKTLYLIIMIQKNIRGFLSRSKLIDNLEKQESFINMLLYIHTLHKKIIFKRFYIKMIINDKRIKVINLINKINNLLIYRFYIKRWKKIIIYSNYIKHWKFTIDKFNILKDIINEKKKEIIKIDNINFKKLETKFKNNSNILEKKDMNKNDKKKKNDEIEHEKNTPRTKRTLVLCFKKKHQVLNNTVDNLEQEIFSEENNFINENYEMMVFRNKKNSVKNLISNSLKKKLENEKPIIKKDKNDITSSIIYDSRNNYDEDKYCKTEIVLKRKNRIKKQINENDKFNNDNNKNNISNRMIEDKNKKNNKKINNKENVNIKNTNNKNYSIISPNKKINKIVKSLSNKRQNEEINTKDKEENKIKEFLINFEKKKHNKRDYNELNKTLENKNEEKKKISSQRNLSIDLNKEKINNDNKLNENKENKREKSSLPTLVKKNNIFQTTIQFQKPTQNILELKEKDKINNLGKDNKELNLHEEIDYVSKFKPPNKIKEILIENLKLNKEILKEKEEQNLIELNNNFKQNQIMNSNNNLFNEKLIKLTQNPNNEVLGYPIPIDYQTINYFPTNNYIENNNQIMNNQNFIHKKNFSSTHLFLYKPPQLGMTFPKKIISNNCNETLSFSNNNINNNQNKILLNCNSNNVLNLSSNNINLNYNNNKIYMKRINICPPKNLNKTYIQHQ